MDNIKNLLELSVKGNKQEKQQAYKIIREHITSNVATDAELELYAHSQLSKIRRLVAWSPIVNDKTLLLLQQDDDEYVADIASSLRKASTALHFLSYNAIIELISALDIEPPDLQVLGSSLNRDVRLAVVNCSLTSMNTLAQLADEPDCEVRELALARLGYEIPVWSIESIRGTLSPIQTAINRPSIFLAVLGSSGTYYSPELLRDLISKNISNYPNGTLNDFSSWVVTKPPCFEHLTSYLTKKLLDESISNQKRLVLSVGYLKNDTDLAALCRGVASCLDCIFLANKLSCKFSQLECSDITLLEFLNGADEHDFIELVEYNDQKMSELSVIGMGIELDVFELTKDQYDLIALDGDFDLVDSEDWELEDIGQYSLAEEVCVYCNGEEIDFLVGGKDDESTSNTGINYTSRFDRITELGKFYAVRAWENKGGWYGCDFKGFFRPQNLNIENISIQLGDGDSAVIMDLYEFQYMQAKSVHECSTRGKGVVQYLVDDSGMVTEV